MFHEMKLYWLGDRPEPAEKWISGLKNILQKNYLITDYEGQSENLAWLGLPFILIGNMDKVNDYLDSLDKKSSEIITDCAYYWILSDFPDDFVYSQSSVVAKDRTIFLNWKYAHYNVVADQLADLTQFSRLTGLSRELAKVRSEISRISAVQTGPWSPALILGESGVGKEEVAHSMYEASKRKGGFGPVACGWFAKGLLQDELFGHEPEAFPGAHRLKKGVLEMHSKGVVFLDDFDAAPKNIFGALLRIMSTPKGMEAEFKRLGGEDKPDVKTSVWLLFSTNADIGKLVEEGKVREDFIFRFEDRVIHIPPLTQRVADIPAIARNVWDKFWSGDQSGFRRPLSPGVIRWISDQEIKWEGNVRTLRALLSLAASMAKMPSHNQDSLGQILKQILSRGSEYRHWVGIVSTPAFTSPLAEDDSFIGKVIDLDRKANDNCSGYARAKKWPATGSEKKAEELLHNINKFKSLLSSLGEPKTNKLVRVSVRLSRAICYVALDREIDVSIYRELNKYIGENRLLGENTARKELNLLEQHGLLEPQKNPRKQVYVRNKNSIKHWN